MRQKKQRVIIYYHSIRDADSKGFERQISYLAKHYKVLSVTELMESPLNNKEILVAITFDDGFVSVVEKGWSVLKKNGLRATMFVPVGNLGQKPQWSIAAPLGGDRNEQVMSRQCVADLDRKGFEMLSHSFSHPILTELEHQKLQVELEQSRMVLEEIVGHKVSGIAYPQGICNKQVVEAARKAGYRYGFTVEAFTVDDSPSEMEIGRFIVKPHMSLMKLKLKVMGAYQVTSYLRKVKAFLLRQLKRKV